MEPSKDGLSKSQITRLFHGQVETNRIDAALETLVTLGALTNYSETTGGRPSSLWSAMEENEPEQNEQSVVGDDVASLPRRPRQII